MLIKGMPINVRAILSQNIMKFQNYMRWRFCYGGLITHFLRAQGIEKEACDLIIPFHPNPPGKIVDVTTTKVLDTSHGPILSAHERQARGDSVITRMFMISELQLRFSGRPITEGDIEEMEECYPISESVVFLCKTKSAFMYPLDDNEANDDEPMDGDMENVDVDEGNSLMLFDGGTTRPGVPRKYSYLMFCFTCALSTMLILKSWGDILYCI